MSTGCSVADLSQRCQLDLPKLSYQPISILNQGSDMEKRKKRKVDNSVAVLKKYNIRRHYESKHGSSYSHITGAERTKKFESFQHSLHSQQAFFSKKKSENETSTRASYKVAYVLAKKGKPFTDGSIIKECIVEAAGELCPEKVNLFKMISLGSNTVARRIEDLGGDIIRQIKEKAKRFCWYSLALDESTDVCDTSQLLVFIRGVDSEFNVTQELASVHSMHTTTTGEDIFNEVSKTMTEYNLEWKQVQCVTIDGGKNMSGTKKDMTGHMNQLNLKLQGKTNLISDYFVHVKAFRAKLALLEGQFQERFADLDAKANEIRLFHNPFDCNAENLPTQFQMEIIDLQADDRLKDKYREGNLIEFYKCLKPDQFPNLKKFACSFVPIFGTTYLCEQTFSKMECVKSNYRANLSDDHLKSILTIGSSNLEPDFNENLKSKRQYHSSH
ncbi:general transcription factor II-I repeat domain-containing protein 2-like [Oratosquilla oratoria]|uniref:general transcription factor II-I repeat domain-containing protein 2-like n=1 Tax=Oratosquilla oratoria TaxID=337810 RepID=UPI003F773E5C